MPSAIIHDEQPGVVGRRATPCIAGIHEGGIMVMVGGIVRVTVEYVAQIISLRMGSLRMGSLRMCMIVPRGFFVMQCNHDSQNNRLM